MKKSHKKIIVVFGAGDTAKVAIDIIEKGAQYEIAGVIDKDRRAGDEFLGYRVLGDESVIGGLVAQSAIHGGVIVLGDNCLRHLIVQRVRALCPSFTVSRSRETENAWPGRTTGPTSVCCPFWFSNCSRTQSAERATLDMRTSSRSPLKS